MKKLIISFAAITIVFLGTSSFSFAGDYNYVEVLVQDKMSVKPEDLPEPVKATISTGAYAGWEITEAFLITKQDKTQYFEIVVKRGVKCQKSI